MANTIRIRRGNSEPASPASFAVGEPAWDQTNGILYIKDLVGDMVQINAGAKLESQVGHHDDTYTYTGGLYGSAWIVYRNRLDLTGQEETADVVNNSGVNAATALNTANMAGLTYS